MSRTGWWRRNRWGLAAVPVALVAALAASSYRVEGQWWLAWPRDLVEAEQGTWVVFTDTQYDRTGDVPFEVRVRLTDVREATAALGYEDEELDLPDGIAAVAVDLELTAAPETPLSGCELWLRDGDGTSYAFEPATPSLRQATSPCVPPDARGPEMDLIEGVEAEPGPLRPSQWQVSPVVLVPAGTEITDVVLTWGAPRGILFSVDPA